MNSGELGVHPESARHSELTEAQYREIKQEFLKPFTNEELNVGWKELANQDSEDISGKQVLVHRFLNGYDFAIQMIESMEGPLRFMESQITDESGDYLAKIVLDESAYSRGDWNMSHRLIETNQMGITGTEFLKQLEEYLEYAASKGYIKLNQVTVKTSQQQVVDWLLKNDYEFTTEEDKTRMEDIDHNPQNYERYHLSSIDDGDYLSEPFYFKKSDINKKQLSFLQDKNFPDGMHLYVSNLNFEGLAGLVRIKLQKRFNTDLAKPE